MDHKPLIPLLNTKHLDVLPPQILRFHLQLAKFDYTVFHVPAWVSNLTGCHGMILLYQHFIIMYAAAYINYIIHADYRLYLHVRIIKHEYH